MSNKLKDRIIPLSTIKWISESSKEFSKESVGFTLKDFEALYGNKIKSMENGEEYMNRLKVMMEKPFSELSESETN